MIEEAGSIETTEEVTVTVIEVTEVVIVVETEIDSIEDHPGTLTTEDATTVERMVISLDNAPNVLFVTESARKPR